ncbi:MAG: PQQ-binding-like beta-propeller repeat protein [Phycisphaerales bacterium]|nr:PQQ-binding-like beta-propeller repeat protein [Phycisphaerales bacterium]
MLRNSNRHLTVGTAAAVLLATGGMLRAELTPEWISRLPVGTSLTAGLKHMVIDDAGVVYITGIHGSSSNTDIITAAYRPDGTPLWQRSWNGPGNWHDQARGVALGPGGVLYVCGNTPGPGSYANVLLLKYDAATGNLLNTIQYSSGPGLSEHAGSVAVDAAGNVYLAGGTVGDGPDAMILKFSAAGAFQWKRVWDGPAQAPYSLDNALQILVEQAGNPVVLIHGVMGSNQPDYVLLKLNPASGQNLWEMRWGGNGGDYPLEMLLDASGDLFVTGSSIITGFNRYGTIRVRGGDGFVLWQSSEGILNHNSARGLAIDGAGGVYVTGSVDPDTDRSNSNDNFYSVKLDAATGALRWSHSYGANCVYCLDFPTSVIADSAAHVFIAGYTVSAPYSGDMILFQLDAATGLEQNRGIVAGNLQEEVVYSRLMRFDRSESLHIGADFYNANTGVYDMSIIKYASLAARLALAVDATCPGGGPIRIEWSGATGGGQAALIFARNTGSFRIPDGNPCAGTALGLGSNQIQLAWQGGAGGNGSRVLNATAGPGACGGYLQLLDITRCAVSNVARVE